VHFLRDFECPSEFTKNQCKKLKLKAIKYCIVNENLYWKESLINFTEGIIDQFHATICGGHYMLGGPQHIIF